MQESFDVATGRSGGLPALSNGEASQAAGHGLVVHANSWPHDLWLDVALALVIAVAAPLLLKKLLETEFAARLLRAPAPSAKAAPSAEAKEEFDFDA